MREVKKYYIAILKLEPEDLQVDIERMLEKHLSFRSGRNGWDNGCCIGY